MVEDLGTLEIEESGSVGVAPTTLNRPHVILEALYKGFRDA